MPSNINFQHQNTYNPNYWGSQQGGRYNYGSESQTSFNKQYFDDFYSKKLNGGFLSMLNNKRVGLLTGPKVDNSDFARYLGLLPYFAAKHNLISDAVARTGSTGALSIGAIAGQQFGPTLEKIPVDNGDSSRMFGMVAQLQDGRQNRYRFQVSEDMITSTLAQPENSNVTPGLRPEIPAETEVLVIPSSISFLGDLINGCISCSRESCGDGYRTLFIQKNAYRNGTMSQGDYAGELVSEVLFVLDSVVLANGDLKLTVKRGANGQTYTDTANSIQYNTASLPLEEGDFILVGTVAFSTECHPRDLGGCATQRPKVFSFCEGVQEFADCLLCVNKTNFKTLASDELLSKTEGLVYDFATNAKTMTQRVYNEFVNGKKVYAANYPMPQHPTLPVGNTFNGSLIPNKIDGILAQFDKRSEELEITFDSCDQQCWEYGLTTIIDAMEAGQMDGGMGKGDSYNSPGWMLVGDIKGLQSIYESRLANFAPMTLSDRQDQLMQFGKSFKVTNRSIFRSANNEAGRAAINEFSTSASSFNIQLVDIQLGSYTFRGIHDYQMARTEPGVMRLMHIPDITFFTDNQDEVMGGVANMLGLGNMSPFAPASAVINRLVPSVISRGMSTTYINGDERFMAKDDCPFNLYGYMRAGVFLSPENISRSLKIRINARIANPDTSPTAPATIKVPINELGCGCARTHYDIVEGLDSWGQGPVLTRPYNFASATSAYRDAILNP